MPTVAFRTAIRDALDEELAADERVILFGEDVAVAGGVFATTTGLYEKYGPDRVFDTPISELALAGAAFGSAVTDLRPVIEIMFGDFLTLAMDSLVNQSTKYWFLTQEQVSVPLVIRVAVDARRREGVVEVGHPRRQPSALLRAQAALYARGRGERGTRAAWPSGRGARRERHHSCHRDEECPRRACSGGCARAGQRVCRGHRPANAASVRRRHRSHLAQKNEPDRRGRGGAADRWLGRGGAGIRYGTSARLPRRRLADRDAEHADSLQPAARGRLSAWARPDCGGDQAASAVRMLATHDTVTP